MFCYSRSKQSLFVSKINSHKEFKFSKIDINKNDLNALVTSIAQKEDSIELVWSSEKQMLIEMKKDLKTQLFLLQKDTNSEFKLLKNSK